jgi:hypothetical protein
MVRRAIWAASLPVLALAAGLAAAPVAAEPIRLDPDALDAVAAGAPKRLNVVTVGQPTVTGTGLAALALKLAGQQRLLLPQLNAGPTSPGTGSVVVTASGKKTFKADRVTKPHTETLVVTGSAVR